MLRVLAIITSIVLTGSAGAVQQVPTVPKQFRGEWNVKLNLCGTYDEDGRLVISERAISYYESIGPVRAVIVANPRDVVVIAQVRGEGETWLARHHLLLSNDLSILTEVFGSHSVSRFRCPQVRQ
jgi:hypothetical protein